MAKTKQQKREEALKRQHAHLTKHVILGWCVYFGLEQKYRTEHGEEVVEDQLIRSAYAAHCDRHGNFLDFVFYKDTVYTGTPQDPFDCALRFKLRSLEEMKNVCEQRDGLNKGRTLYQIAYGK